MKELEIWKDVKGYEGLYQVSNLGRIKSLERYVRHRYGGMKLINEKVLKPGVTSTGYLIVVLRKDNKSKTRKVHQLVAIAFLNHIPCGFKVVVDHKDNNPLNNRKSNLQLITNRENSSKDKQGGSSQYLGVCWHKSKKKWYASIDIDGKSKHLGSFHKEIDAAEAYRKARKELSL